jgi:DMATS type aromatic prenyltransferase
MLPKDKLYWERLFLSQLKPLLVGSSSYGTDQVNEQIDWISKHLINLDVFGPRPTSIQPFWKSETTQDYSPIEYSISISRETCSVRFAFEPISEVSGTSVDPVNRTPALEWLAQRQALDVTDDLRWFQTLSHHLVLDTRSLSDSCRTSLKPEACGLSQHLFAFDLAPSSANPLLKCYIFPKALAKQQSSTLDPATWQRQILANIGVAMKAIGFDSQWQMVVSYLSTFNQSIPDPSYAGSPIFLGFDLVSPSEARMKPYVRFPKANLNEFLRHIDLGGLLCGRQIDEVKNAATEIWRHFENGPLSADDDTRRENGVIVYYEFRHGHHFPFPKCGFSSVDTMFHSY